MAGTSTATTRHERPLVIKAKARMFSPRRPGQGDTVNGFDPAAHLAEGTRLKPACFNFALSA